jgi:hypothetical protein
LGIQSVKNHWSKKKMMNAFLMMMVDRWSDETVSHSFSREKKIKLNWTDKKSHRERSSPCLYVIPIPRKVSLLNSKMSHMSFFPIKDFHMVRKALDSFIPSSIHNNKVG